MWLEHVNILIRFLGEFCREYLLEEKIFVVPSYQMGHQIGESLTKAGHSWVNLRFATLPSLAQGFEFDYVGVIFGNDLVYDLDEQRIVSAK